MHLISGCRKLSLTLQTGRVAIFGKSAHACHVYRVAQLTLAELGEDFNLMA